MRKIQFIDMIPVRAGKLPVTRMFVIQLAETHKEMAVGVKDQEAGNISGTSIQGIGPSPTAKKETKQIKNKGEAAGKKEKENAKAIKQVEEPATLKRATGLLPARSNNQIATNVIIKLIKVNKTGVKRDPSFMREE